MNISFLLSQMGDGGSGQTLTHKIAEYLSKSDTVSVISIYNSSLSKNHNYKVYDLESSTNKYKQLLNLFKLKKIIKKEKTEILVCQHTSFFYCYIKLISNVRVIWVDHGSLWWRHRKINNKMNTLWRERIILKHSDKIVSLTNDNKEAYKTFFPEYCDKVHVIPNFVSVDLPKYGYNFDSKKIITVGRCDTGKDYGTTINCFEKATINNPEWKLYIYAAGGGSL